MSPQFTIITAAMSLGGMASVGFTHFGQVEKQVAEHHLKVEEVEEQVEVAEVGERVETVIAEFKESLRVEREKEREDYNAMFQGVAVEVELLKQQQEAHDVLMSSLSQQQNALDFRFESLSGQFRPLRATNSRFIKVKSGSKSDEFHPLLPPVESSWTENY